MKPTESMIDDLLPVSKSEEELARKLNDANAEIFGYERQVRKWQMKAARCSDELRPAVQEVLERKCRHLANCRRYRAAAMDLLEHKYFKS